MMHRKISLIFFIIFLLTSSICFARTFSMPVQTTSYAVIPVNASLLIDKIETLDKLDQIFILHGALISEWTDTRLHNHICTSPVHSKNTCVYSEHFVDSVFDNIWHPDLNIVNVADKPQYEHQKLTLSNTGKARYEVQFNAKIRSSLTLKEMPLNKQALFIHLKSFSWDDQHLFLQIGNIAFHDKTSRLNQGWNIDHYNYRCTLDESPQAHKSFYKCTVKLDINRRPHYFIFRFIVPTFIFVLIAWLSFMITPNDRMRLTLGCLLALVVYELYISNKVPYIHDITKIDLFFILGIISIGFTILYHAIEAKRSIDEEKKQNKQFSYIPRPLSKYWRILMISGYFVAALLIILL